MSRNTLVGRLLTPAGFAVALALFLLPFLTFSCSGPATPSEDVPIGADTQLSMIFTGTDLLFNGTPTVRLEHDGGAITIDASDLPEGTGGTTDSQEPVPTKIRAPMIGAAGALLAGVLFAFVTTGAVRKVLAAVAAVAGAGALAYVVYVGAPDYLDTDDALNSADLPRGVNFEVGPAVGFWAIAGVLLVVLLLQFVPNQAEPATSAPVDPFGAPIPPPVQPAVAPPTVAPPTVAPPTVADPPPTVAPPTVADPPPTA